MCVCICEFMQCVCVHVCAESVAVLQFSSLTPCFLLPPHQGILHPLVARVIWGYSLLSPFRFCDKPWDPNYTRSYNDCVSTSCSSCPIFDKLYAIDFAGGGAVHLLGKSLCTNVYVCACMCVNLSPFPTGRCPPVLYRWGSRFGSVFVC